MKAECYVKTINKLKNKKSYIICLILRFLSILCIYSFMGMLLSSCAPLNKIFNSEVNNKQKQMENLHKQIVLLNKRISRNEKNIKQLYQQLKRNKGNYKKLKNQVKLLKEENAIQTIQTVLQLVIESIMREIKFAYQFIAE